LIFPSPNIIEKKMKLFLSYFFHLIYTYKLAAK
jgi:hypothetical protein